MLEEIVAENIAPLPPGLPPCDCRREEQLKRFESDIRMLKNQVAEKNSNLVQLKETSKTELEARLIAFREAAKKDLDAMRKIVTTHWKSWRKLSRRCKNWGMTSIRLGTSITKR